MADVASLDIYSNTDIPIILIYLADNLRKKIDKEFPLVFNQWYRDHFSIFL